MSRVSETNVIYQRQRKIDDSTANLQVKTPVQELQRLNSTNTRYSSVSYSACPECRVKDNEIKQLKAEILHIRNTQEQLQRKYDEVLRREWTIMKTSNEEEDQRTHFDQNIRELLRENQNLVVKLRNTENRVYILEDANKSLRKEILDNANARILPSYNHCFSQNAQCLNPPPPTVIIRPLPQPHSYQMPRSNSSYQNFRTYRPSPPKRNFRENACTCHHISPLTVLDKERQMPHQSSYTMENFYQRDMLGERYGTLQRKIKKLERENTKLREYVCPIHG